MERSPSHSQRTVCQAEEHSQRVNRPIQYAASEMHFFVANLEIAKRNLLHNSNHSCFQIS